MISLRRVMIPIKKIDIDARILEPHHLLVEKQGRLEALEANVIQVSGDDHEVHALGDGRVQNFLKGAARSVANLMNRSPGITNQPDQRRIEVNVSCVDKLHMGPKAAAG